MIERWLKISIISFLFIFITACAETSIHDEGDKHVTPISELEHIDIFQQGALEHILEGELNQKGRAVGFHYDRLPTKKGEIVTGTKTKENEFGVYEAKVIIEVCRKNIKRRKFYFFS